MYDVEKLVKRIEYCNRVIDELGGEFDPVASLADTENRMQRLYSLAVHFLDDLDKLMDDFTENAKKCL